MPTRHCGNGSHFFTHLCDVYSYVNSYANFLNLNYVSQSIHNINKLQFSFTNILTKNIHNRIITLKLLTWKFARFYCTSFSIQGANMVLDAALVFLQISIYIIYFPALIKHGCALFKLSVTCD